MLLGQTSKHRDWVHNLDSWFVRPSPQQAFIGGFVLSILLLATQIPLSHSASSSSQVEMTVVVEDLYSFRKITGEMTTKFSSVIQIPMGKIKSLVICATRCARDESCAVFGYVESNAMENINTKCIIGVGPVESVSTDLVDATPWENSIMFKKIFSTQFQTLTCSSRNYNQEVCPAHGFVLHYEIHNQLSTAPCTRDVSVGITSDGNLFVDDGCRGVFKLTIPI